MRMLITASRNWTDRVAIRDAMIKAGRDAGCHPQEVTVVHGGARGGDSIADALAREFGCSVEVHVADWARHGGRAGPLRNAEMVRAGADVCLAFPLGESRGTRGCMRLAAAAGIPVVDHDPALAERNPG